MSLLEVKDLKTYFYTDAGVGKAVDGVTFSLEKGKVLGIVGESGCGKSVTSLSIMRLVDTTTGKYEGGEILFEGRDILKLPEKEMPMRTVAEIGELGEKDLKRGHNLSKACDRGNGAHGQFMTGIRVNFDLTFTNKAWVEAERYRFLEFVSS